MCEAVTICEFEVWREKNQQDATIRCLLLTSISTCFGHHYAHLQENKDRVTAYGVLFWFWWMWLVAAVGRCVVGCEQCNLLVLPWRSAFSFALVLHRNDLSTRRQMLLQVLLSVEWLSIGRRPSFSISGHVISWNEMQFFFRHPRNVHTFMCKTLPGTCRWRHSSHTLEMYIISPTTHTFHISTSFFC